MTQIGQARNHSALARSFGEMLCQTAPFVRRKAPATAPSLCTPMGAERSSVPEPPFWTGLCGLVNRHPTRSSEAASGAPLPLPSGDGAPQPPTRPLKIESNQPCPPCSHLAARHSGRRRSRCRTS